MSESRLPPQPSQMVDRSTELSFSYDGKLVRAYQGDTIASALYAAGRRIFSRSFKYHRPRGLLCVNGKCPNCMVNLDGVPNVRSCTTPVSGGMDVRHQNAWPSPDHDVFSVFDRLDRFLPVGFYYKTFIHPKFVWPIAQRVIRRLTGLGKIDRNAESKRSYEHYNRQTDVAVVGGGPAGIAAAVQAARAGADVTLVDDQPALGGHLRTDGSTHPEAPQYADAKGHEIAAQMASQVEGLTNLRVLSNATVFSFYEGNLLGVAQGEKLIRLRSKRVVVATGSHDVPSVFPGNDLPGVMLSTGVRRLMHLYGVKPGEKALVVTNNPQGYRVASELLQAGVDVVAVADARQTSVPDDAEPEALKARGVPILPSYTVKEARGGKRVKSATVMRVGGGEEKRFACDLLCLAVGSDTASSLLYQAGCDLHYDEDIGETVPDAMTSGVYAAGDVTGIHDLQAAILQGEIAGLEAAASLQEPFGSGPLLEQAQGRQDPLEEAVKRARERAQGQPALVSPIESKKKFVCFCEDVTEKDIRDAIAEGFDEMQTLKRYSTLAMGPCQGKMCLKSAIKICAGATGHSIGETGTTTLRPPIQPVPVGMLAGPSHIPVKLTPMDAKHRELGAKMMDLGPWKRPHSYGSVEEEHKAVRERVGIIDVSTLGKLYVQGADAPALMDKVYTHIFSNLALGRIRYGLLCSDNGMIIDDGTITRLAEDVYFITTTSGNVDLMEEWLKWWLVGTDMCAHVDNVTAGYAAINVAGPRARETLSKLTDINLETASLGYMRSGRGDVAGVPSMLLRIGFVGEAGWEIHFPSEYGEYMWDTLMEAGREFGIAPFGVEAQRILRLEKKHVIIGQDTDMISTPLGADMSWVVRFDKEDFIGRPALDSIQQEGIKEKLVGFVMEDDAVPEDGVPVVIGGIPVGRVTSSRYSPTLGRGFGLLWVPLEFSQDGTDIHVQVNDKPQRARVYDQAFYDPEGKKLRE